MSKVAINQYYQNLDRAIQYGKSRNEQSIRNYFWMLLNDYAHKYNYELVTEISVQGTKGAKVRPDGVLKNRWSLDVGLWESKDEKDDIDTEIDAKQKKGYPLTNILFEDSHVAVLFQHGAEVMRVQVRDTDALDKILTAFVTFKSEIVTKFEEAIERFKADIPTILDSLRTQIDQSSSTNTDFAKVQHTFWELCRAEINPDITLADVREMMIQHILTSDIFNRVFDDPEFHRHNTIAAELEKLIATLYSYADRRNLLHSIAHYYEAINAAAAGITDHHEKQKFLKALYENFYKVYNPKAADRLGVVYTPNEIVRFMVDSTNHLLERHFGKTLADRNVEILDPATGTGTFVCDIIENAIPPHLLEYKYKNEIHANEVAILPYYIAHLNIEYTFKQKMNYYAEFTNLCFVDTLDNVGALAYTGKQYQAFGLTSENTERIKRQNNRKISVVIGNPPYNANQANFNDFNQNRLYKDIDVRIKETYVKYSKATNKANLYDMYVRFYRWASDRVDKNGVLCFITNNSFVNNKAFDGFRKMIQDEFDYAYIIDMGGNIRELSGKDGIWMNEEHTIFGVAAAVGIAMMFLVKKQSNEKKSCHINYIHPCDIRATRIEKFDWLKNTPFPQIPFNHIIHDKNNNWINQTDNDFDDLLQIHPDKTKKHTIYENTSLGIDSHRDYWVYDFNILTIKNKIDFFISVFNQTITDDFFVDKNRISWSRELKKYHAKKEFIVFNEIYLRNTLYRPYIKKFHYSEKKINSYLFDIYNYFPQNKQNFIISMNMPTNNKDFFCLSSSLPIDLHFTGDSKCLPLYRYDKEGNRIDNITDWGLEQFVKHYHNDTITKQDIFHYTYGVLHNPAYRTKYELNLKREFPRLPFYANFAQWAAWGKELMELHIGYETVTPYKLQRVEAAEPTKGKKSKELFAAPDQEPQALYAHQPKIKTKLKADKVAGVIEIDELTTLKGIPPEAWAYKLGNRSALEWILDQYKESTPSDPTIAEKFNTYRFADYKEQVIDLLQRVTTVSVRTMQIISEMERAGE